VPHPAISVVKTNISACALILAGGALSTAFGSAPQRQRAGGPPGGNLFHVAVSSSGPPTLFTSALQGGIFRSSDGGTSWEEVDNGLPGDAFCELVIDRRVTRVVYAVCGERVFKTVDGGGHWAPLTLPAPARHQLVIAPSDSNVLYMPGNKYREVFVSRTGGRTWTVVAGQ